MSKVIRVDTAVREQITKIAAVGEKTPNDTLRRVLGLPPKERRRRRSETR